MDYGRVLSRAWEITWRWRILWILGFLVSLGRGAASSGSNGSYSVDSSDWGIYGPRIPPGAIAALVAITCVAILVAIAIWVVSIIARGGLIAGVQQVEDEGSTGFGQAWRVGASRFWTLFGIAILAAIPLLILVVVGIVTLAMLITGTVGVFDASRAGGMVGIGASVLCGGTLCCGLVLLAIILDLIRTYAERAAILEGLGWIEAFKRGWQVIRENPGPTAVFWVIFLVIGLVFFLIFLVIGLVWGVIVVSGVAVIAVPLMAVFTQADPGPWIVAPICCGGLLGAIVFALICSVVETFTSATWTLVYRELTGLALPPAEEPVMAPMA